MDAVQPMPVRSPDTRVDASRGPAGSSLEPLPWFPFAVAMSRGQDDAGAFCADAVERRYVRLARRYGIEPRLTLLILDAADWAAHAEHPVYGQAHLAGATTLVVPAHAARGPADADRAVAHLLARLFASHTAIAKAAA